MTRSIETLSPTYVANCRTWLRYNGKRGTDKQVLAVCVPDFALVRMLTERQLPVAG